MTGEESCQDRSKARLGCLDVAAPRPHSLALKQKQPATVPGPWKATWAYTRPQSVRDAERPLVLSGPHYLSVVRYRKESSVACHVRQ